MKIKLKAFFLVLVCLNFAQCRIGTFWHVTDFHLDVNYTTQGDTSAMCWYKSRSPHESQSQEENTNNKPGPYGDYLCDAPLKLVESAVDAMKDIHPNPDFIMWTGDDTAHVDDQYFSTDDVENIINNITQILATRFPNTACLPIMGNHDYYPKNQLPPGVSDLQTRVANLWEDWLQSLGDNIFDSFNTSGRYLADIKDSKVSVMALNTLIWYQNNKETAQNASANDPDGQFAWADKELTDLAKKGRRVYLMGHIPPGSFERYQQKTEGFHWYQDRYNERFIKLIQDHADVIEAQFFAHHHTDSFRLFFQDDKRDDEAKPLSYQLIAPGVSPWKSTLSEETGANNPGIRLVSYDTQTGKITEVTTYYLNLTKANNDGGGNPNWEFEYNFTSYYGLKDVSATSLFSLSKQMKVDTVLFDKYYSANTVKNENPSVCTNKCHKLHWCSITEVDYKRFRQCNSSPILMPGSGAFLMAAVFVLWIGR